MRSTASRPPASAPTTSSSTSPCARAGSTSSSVGVGDAGPVEGDREGRRRRTARTAGDGHGVCSENRRERAFGGGGRGVERDRRGRLRRGEDFDHPFGLIIDFGRIREGDRPRTDCGHRRPRREVFEFEAFDPGVGDAFAGRQFGGHAFQFLGVDLPKGTGFGGSGRFGEGDRRPHGRAVGRAGGDQDLFVSNGDGDPVPWFDRPMAAEGFDRRHFAPGGKAERDFVEHRSRFGFDTLSAQREGPAFGFHRHPLDLRLPRGQVGRPGDREELPGRRRRLGDPGEAADGRGGGRDQEERLRQPTGFHLRVLHLPAPRLPLP